ncbi:MAG: PAS domain S-box protein [Deltaproteobacteria bacterium]|jgi:PAS domain S-box-containing protein|nr:PAS domain S-box protein [Deltaproteobacteria bacterium]
MLNSSTIHSKKLFKALLLSLLCWFFIETAQHNYLLFHSSVELFSIFVAFGIFVIAWNSQEQIDNNYLLILGIAYLFIGFLDLLHTFSYKGLGIFPAYDANLPTQLWIASRYTESITLMIAPFLVKRPIRIPLVYCIYGSVTFLTIGAIFIWDIFPACYIEGVGLTSFKKISEYLISLFVIAAIIFLLKKKDSFEPYVIKLMVLSLLFTIVSEFAFTFYVSVYGFSNLVGHLFKLFSFYCIYLALIRTGLKEPYNLLYRNLKHSEERFRLLAETSPIGICLSDEKKQCQYVNNKWTEMTGIKNRDAIGQPCDLGVHPEDREHLLALDSNLPAEGVEYRIQARNGKITWVYGFMAAMKDEGGNVLGYLRTDTDITDRKKAEEKLKALSEKIKKFSYSMTHDLKNPANVIRWLAESLNKKYRHLLDEKGKEFCEIILSSAKELVFMVEKINSYIATGENLLRPEKFRIFEIMSSLKDEFAPQLSGKNIQLSAYQGTDEIVADKLALMRALRNLVENAIKYGGDKLTEIKIGYRSTESHHLINVSDDGAGIGIAPDKNAEIFTEFKRASSAVGIQGSGLGLAIVQEVAAQHGGKAWLESNMGKWTTFFLSISKQIETGFPKP